jgi:hypothetical protein
MSLTVLPDAFLIVIAGHLAATLERPKDNLRNLQATCSSMRHIYGDRAIGLHVSLDRVSHRIRSWNDLVNYNSLLASLTTLDNSEACFLTRISIALEVNHSP